MWHPHDAILSSKYLLDIELQLPNIDCPSLRSDFELGFKFSVLYWKSLQLAESKMADQIGKVSPAYHRLLFSDLHT